MEAMIAIEPANPVALDELLAADLAMVNALHLRQRRTDFKVCNQ